MDALLEMVLVILDIVTYIIPNIGREEMVSKAICMFIFKAS